MTSESDSASGRRPPTIELTATEVEPPKAPQTAKADTPNRQKSAESAATQEAPNPKPAAKFEGRLLAHGISAAIGAIAATAVLVGLWLTGFMLARDVVTEAAAPDLRANSFNAAISARLDKIEHAIQAPIQAPHPETATVPPALGNRLTAVELQAKMLGDTLAALNRRADDIAAAAQTAQKQAASASTTADTAKNAGQTGVQRADLDARGEPDHGAGKRGEGAFGRGRASDNGRRSGRALDGCCRSAPRRGRTWCALSSRTQGSASARRRSERDRSA